jgi:hypothetical protein
VLWCLSPLGLLMWAWNIIGNPNSVCIFCVFFRIPLYICWVMFDSCILSIFAIQCRFLPNG